MKFLVLGSLLQLDGPQQCPYCPALSPAARLLAGGGLTSTPESSSLSPQLTRDRVGLVSDSLTLRSLMHHFPHWAGKKGLNIVRTRGQGSWGNGQFQGWSRKHTGERGVPDGARDEGKCEHTCTHMCTLDRTGKTVQLKELPRAKWKSPSPCHLWS